MQLFTPDIAERPHVLVVDDDTRIRELLFKYLKKEGFFVLTAESADHAEEFLEHAAFDVIVMDIMMPGQTGLELTQKINHLTTPIILLTALGEAHDRIKGLEVGADDYLAKPFEPKELLLRINALLKRSGFFEKTKAGHTIGPWVFHPDNHELHHAATQTHIALTGMESQLLCVFMEHRGEILSRDDLAAKCGLEGESRSIDVQITRLRRKIEENPKSPRLIQTVRGQGYRLREE